MAVIRVGLVDDQPLFTAGLAMIVDSQPDLSVAWQAADGAEAISSQQQLPAEIIVMDIQMPQMDGLTATRELLGHPNPGKVIILTTFDTDANVLGAVEAGASGFLLKDSEPVQILAAIRTVHAGDAVISPGPTRRLIQRLRPSAPLMVMGGANSEALAALTQRELQVLKLIARGLTNSEICDQLWLSMATVKTHIGHLLTKTGCRDRVQLVLFALRAGAIQLDEILTPGLAGH